jgi:hypothetical protein
MTKKIKNVAEVESIFDYLLGIVTQAMNGDIAEDAGGAFDYARIVVNSASQQMRSTDMYDQTLQAFNDAERLLNMKDFTGAYKILEVTSYQLMEKSGTTENLRIVLDKFKLVK